ncbi:glycoside hydrolase family 3 C-terminal domain-containing protein [Microbacterium sp. ZXX196]|uniref:glycoside hydrolase family 3 C-terminal domain-containing protein n=1 Tax=Microbacterium sp. ZXX196 TaxID=2609291 RepID=UPI0012B975A3|nr:glycoside hydrolase family 3 C-terminal domain-containing protein [Microbacterium sp. ZXX196]MTE23940.1 beta-glucosidase [Microbacterium sp. ZXX196]
MSTNDFPDVSQLTLEEKAALTSGLDFWRLKAVERLNVPSIMVTDGPHGLRKQAGESDHLGLNESVPATCFPPAVGLGASWDPELAARVGAAIGREAAIEDVAVVLGPGVNIKRSVLCGRNFEYFSEDPILASDMGSGVVRGIQGQGVGTSLKHFAANNQETDRMRVSSDVDPRPLREIYLRAFQGVVEDEQPWTVMCSYNRVNGVYASEDPFLLTQVLREEWGFEGLVVSDWGASNVRTAGIRAGMDLEMPSSGGMTDRQLVDAVRNGSLAEADLDRSAARVLQLIRRATERAAVADALDVDAHHALAREAAARSIVLLKNDDQTLPLQPSQRIAVIGEFAEKPRFQGGGSSHINPTRVDVALDSIRQVAADVTYAAGYVLPEAPEGIGMSGRKAEKPTEDVLVRLRAEAAEKAAAADVAIVFLGLPDEDESEGFDRTHIELPAEQLALLDAVVEANPRVVVVLSNGGVVALPFADRVPAILETWLLGQAGGAGTADVLFGEVNPSGRLAETFPFRIEDTPAFTSFPGQHQHVRYGEGIYVGYRWYDARAIDVAFPFGHGLSYTTFSYGEPTVTATEDGGLAVALDVTNTGSVAGREVVQAYVSVPGTTVERAPRELKAFHSVELAAGETARVELAIRRRDLAYWETRTDAWVVEPGTYRVEVGASSRDLRGAAETELAGDELVIPVTRDSSIGDVFAHPAAAPVARELFAGSPFGEMMLIDGEPSAMGEAMPLGRLVSFGMPAETVEKILAAGK